MTVEDKLQLLGIQEVTTDRQQKNGTRVFKLPIKDMWCKDGSVIHVASYKSGYVRRLTIGRGTSDYQLNKRIDGEPEYFESGKKDSMGRPMYTKFTTRTCKLIPDEVDRLEYLITYCLKNYYIGHANKVARSSDEYVPKWLYDEANKYRYRGGQIENVENGDIYVHEQHAYWNKREEPEVKVIINGHRYNIT
jgi:hypothetical protein